jgi:Protein of unknown function (DUF2911)
MFRRGRFAPLFLAVLLLMSAVRLGAQNITLPPSGDNPQASVMQAIGPVRVTIDYSSPRVIRETSYNGEYVVRGKNDRRGKIWGDLVPYGMSDLGFNGCASCPWRAGANENTTFTVTHDVQVQGQKLPAGTYGLHMIPGKDEWTIIFSKDAAAWGSYWYDAKNDALRVKTKPAKSDYHEWLTYEFTERDPAKATVALKWEELQVPVTIEVPSVNELWVESIRKELRGLDGFLWQNWQAAAQFCAENNINLAEGLAWAQRAVSDPTWSGGEENLLTLTTLARLQEMNGKTADAEKTYAKAYNSPSATPVQLHQAARALQREGKKEQAIKLYQLNAKRFPNQWPVHVGLMRAYAAMGDNKKALAEAKLALAQAPDAQNKKTLEGAIQKLEKGEPIPD